MTTTFFALVLAMAVQPVASQKPASPATPRPETQAPLRGTGEVSPDPYFEFMRGRFLESRGEIDAAISAYQQAMALDPGSAEIPAELAGLYARQNRAREAIGAAERALQHNPEHREAHRILGVVYAAMADSSDENRSAASPSRVGQYSRLAIEHLEKVGPGPSGDVDANVSLTLGRLYLRSRSFDRAIGALSDVLEVEPGYPQAIALLAQAYGAAGRTKEAIELLEGAVDQEPGFYPALAEALERERRWPEAAAAYESAARASPTNTELKVKRANAMMNVEGGREMARARDLLADVVQKVPTHGYALYLLARAQRETGQLDKSEATARRLLTMNPKSLWGAHSLAQLFEQRREYGKVIEALVPLIPPENESTAGREADITLLLTHVGFAHQELGQYDRALAAFERAFKLSPDDAAVEGHVIQAQISGKHYQAAVAQSAKARAHFPDDLRIATLSSRALQKAGSVDEALAIAKEAAEVHAAEPAAHLALAELLVEAKREGAVEVLTDASRKFPGDMSVLFQLASVYERQKRFGEAEKTFRHVIEQNPQNAPALNSLGYLLADRGERLDESVEYIQRALQIDPTNAAYLDSLGWVYFKLNRLDLAEQNLQQAAEQLQRDSVVQDHFGDVLFKRGRFTEAIAAWQRALAGDLGSIEKPTIDEKIRDAQEKARRK